MNALAIEKPIGLAMVVSTAVHLMAGAGLLWLLANFVQPTDTQRLLVLKFSESRRDDPSTNPAATDAPTARVSKTGVAATANQSGLRLRTPAPAEQENRKPAPQPVPEARTDAGVSTPPFERPEPAETAPMAAQQAPTTEVSEPQTSAQTIEARTVTTAPSERAVVVSAARQEPAESPKATVSPAQKKMLDKKLRRWTHKLHKMLPADTPHRWTHKGQPYEARFKHFPSRGDTDLEKVVVEVLTEQNGEILRTEMQMKMLAFSHFAQFVNRWDERVQIHDDTLDGRFHSNSTINLSWDRHVQPTFLGKVTTAARNVRYGDTRGYRNREEIFSGGIETGVRSIPLATRYRAEEADAAVHGRKVFEFSRDTVITFHRDGSFSWRDEVTPPRRERIGDGSTYLLGAKGTTLSVQGEVRGTVTVYTPGRIVIIGDITYAQDGLQAGIDDSFLGLVAGKSVEIAEPEVTGPGPLYVHASIYAGRRFRVRDYRAKEQSQLYIYGSLTAGSISATEPRFATHIEFDRRLEEQRPAGYPVTKRFELDGWDEAWTPVPASPD